MSPADSSPPHPLASAPPWPCCASQTGSSVSEAGPESGPSPRRERAAPRTPRRARRSPPAASRTCGVALSLSGQTRWCCTTRRAPTRTAVSAWKGKRLATHVAGVAQVAIVVDHALQHRVDDVAELERRRLLAQGSSIKDMRSAVNMIVMLSGLQEWQGHTFARRSV
jgi:hypothetical protein